MMDRGFAAPVTMSEALRFVKAILSRRGGRSTETGDAREGGDGEASFDMSSGAGGLSKCLMPSGPRQNK